MKLQKIGADKLEELMEKLEFYDFNNLYPKNNKELIVKFNSGINNITHEKVNFEDSVNLYTLKKRMFINFINSIIENLDDEVCVIRKYNESWIINKKKAKKLYVYFKEHNIKNRYDKAIYIEKDSELIKLLIESILKYNSFIEFIFKESKIVITPTDHMDIFIRYEEDAIVDKIKSEILKYNNNEEMKIINDRFQIKEK